MLTNLRPGAITAAGWLREQLIRSRDGCGGHLDELEPAMLRDPYISHGTDAGWGAVKAGWGAEISGNFWFAEVCLAYSLDDDYMKRKVADWVEQVLAAQYPDGYMGAYTESDPRWDDYNAWGTACGMRAMLLYAEAEARADVVEAVRRCMRWFCDNWREKTRYAGPYIIETMVWCYRLCGDEQLLDFAKEYQAWLCENDLFENSKRAYLSDDYHYNSNHTSAYANMVRLPGELYPFTHDPTDLQASVKGVEKLRRYSVHVTGAPCCNNEYVSPRVLNGDSEYCSFTFMHSTYAVLAGLTGEAKYGDWMEELVFNAAEGARRKDERSIAYMSSPNQVFIEGGSSKYENSPHTYYAPIHPVACCAVNAVAILPDYVRSMAMEDDGELYVIAYGPAVIRFGGLTLTEETLYPFRNRIRFTAQGAGRFPLHLKVPDWALDWELTRNGAPVSCERDARGFVCTEVAAGDTLEISFRAEPVALRIDDGDASGKYPISVKYGALVFALHIREDWYVSGEDKARSPLPEGWHWWAARPAPTDAPPRPPYEWSGYAKYDIYWNVAVDEATVGASLRVIEKEPGGYVWDNPPLALEMDAYKAPYLIPPYPQKTFDVYGDMQPVTDKLRLELEPFGATALRITYFPRGNMSAVRR